MTKLKIKLFGGVDLGGHETYALTRKVKGVAAFLALQQGQPQSREKIAVLFWENSPEKQARTNLRQCLSSLRKQLRSALITRDDLVLLDLSQVELDVIRFEELVTSEDAYEIEEAVSIYKGDLLDGFSIREERFESWLRPERERYRNLMIDGLTRLISAKEASADHSAVATLAARLLVLDPINEAAHRTLMKTYAAQGRQEAALKQFETCRLLLDRELNVQPQPETIALFKQLRSDRTSRGCIPATNAETEFIAPELHELGIDTSISSKPSIIIVPFKDLSANGHLGHLAEGIRIDVQSALAKISGLFLIAAGSASTYADQTASPEQVSREMAVQYILEGSVQGHNEQLRVTAQLTDGLNRQVVWSERYNRTLDDTFIVQDEIVDRIVTSLDVKLVSGEQARVWRKTFRNPKALELYYKGLELLISFDKDSVTAARHLFEKVAEISPDVTLGPTCVAFCHYWDVTMGWSDDPDSALNQAAEWSEKAASMEDADGQAHAILAHIELLRGRHDEALEIAEEAIRIRPLCANTNALSGNILLYCGQPMKSIERVKAAIRYAPVYASWWLEILAAAYLDAGQNQLAFAAAEELLRKSPQSTNGQLILISALIRDGRHERVKELAAKILAMNPEFTLSRYAEQQPYQDSHKLRRNLENLREAGLPE